MREQQWEVPIQTKDLIKYLEEMFEDKIETDPKIVGTPEYWKKVGVIEMLQTLKIRMSSDNPE